MSAANQGAIHHSGIRPLGHILLTISSFNFWLGGIDPGLVICLWSVSNTARLSSHPSYTIIAHSIQLFLYYRNYFFFCWLVLLKAFFLLPKSSPSLLSITFITLQGTTSVLYVWNSVLWFWFVLSAAGMKWFVRTTLKYLEPSVKYYSWSKLILPKSTFVNV